MTDRITVTPETFGGHDDGPDVVVVRVDGEEVGAYCIVDDVEAEVAAMRRMVQAVATAAAGDARAPAMTGDELEAIRERLGRRVHHVTPDHEAALALLAEVDRLREESRRYRAAVSEHLHRRMQDVLGEYDAAQEHRREAAEEMRRRAVEVCRDTERAYQARADRHHAMDANTAQYEADAVERVAHQIAALPTSTEAPDGVTLAESPAPDGPDVAT